MILTCNGKLFNLKSDSMKIKLAVIIALLMSLASCKQSETPESVAEKYLCDLRSDLSELGFWNAGEHDNRSLALMLNEQADSIISGGKIPAMSALFHKYFQNDKVFSYWELLNVSECSVNLYRVFDLTEKTDRTMLDTYLSMESYASKKIIHAENAATFLDTENVPLYKIKYKVDSRHVDFVGDEYSIATVGVIKHPEDGYKVVSFMWDE